MWCSSAESRLCMFVLREWREWQCDSSERCRSCAAASGTGGSGASICSWKIGQIAEQRNFAHAVRCTAGITSLLTHSYIVLLRQRFKHISIGIAGRLSLQSFDKPCRRQVGARCPFGHRCHFGHDKCIPAHLYPDLAGWPAKECALATHVKIFTDTRKVSI